MLTGIDPIFYEFLNMVVASLSIVVVVIFARYLRIEAVEGRLRLRDWLRGRAALRHQMGISMLAICTGDGLTRGWTWWARFCANINLDASWMREFDFFPKTTGIILTLGLLCAIRVFAPDSWGRWAWAFCVAIIALEAAFFAYWHY